VCGARVVHRWQDARDFELRVESGANLLDRAEKQIHAPKGEVLRLDGDDKAVRGGQGVERKQREEGGQSIRM
jgi:hypothetical protein